MSKSLFLEVFLVFILITLALLLLNPFHIWMPDSTHMIMVGALLVVFGFFALLIWKQKASDEREELHRLTESRVAYTVGAGTLLCGLIFQSFQHQVDAWLVAALCLMFVSKILSSLFLSKYR